MGPYSLTALISLFGPAERVAAESRRGGAARIIGSGTEAGTSFAVEVPTHVTALIDFTAGASASSAFGFDSARSPRRARNPSRCLDLGSARRNAANDARLTRGRVTEQLAGPGRRAAEQPDQMRLPEAVSDDSRWAR